MAISTTPDFKNVSWEPYNKEKILSPSLDITKLYIKFRSITGGETEVMEQEINRKKDSESKKDLATEEGIVKEY